MLFRSWLQTAGCGFGAIAFHALSHQIAAASESLHNAQKLHHEPKAKRVIFLFMHGGVSQVDSFDPKPMLKKYDGKDLPFKGLDTLDIALKEDLKKNVLATASGEDGQAAERQQFDAYDILEFRQQVVAGMVYHMKIRLSASTGECVHVRVFQPLPYTGLGPEIQKWELHATADDPLNTL